MAAADGPGYSNWHTMLYRDKCFRLEHAVSKGVSRYPDFGDWRIPYFRGWYGCIPQNILTWNGNGAMWNTAIIQIPL